MDSFLIRQVFSVPKLTSAYSNPSESENNLHVTRAFQRPLTVLEFPAEEEEGLRPPLRS
jgi:hypothetical protein